MWDNVGQRKKPKVAPPGGRGGGGMPTMRKDNRVVVRIPKDLLERAKAKGMDVSQLLTSLIVDELAKSGIKPEDLGTNLKLVPKVVSGSNEPPEVVMKRLELAEAQAKAQIVQVEEARKQELAQIEAGKLAEAKALEERHQKELEQKRWDEDHCCLCGTMIKKYPEHNYISGAPMRRGPYEGRWACFNCWNENRATHKADWFA